MRYDWIVINVGISEAQDELNKLDNDRFEIFGVYPFVQDNINALTIVARRPKKQDRDIRY